MLVSHNELTSLLKQAFEGCGVHQGLYEAAAKSLVWSQANGFDGLSALQLSIDSIKAPELTIAKRAGGSNDLLALEVSSSAAFWGAPAVGLVLVKALSTESCELVIHGGCDHKLMLNSIVDAASKNFYVRCSWPLPEGRALAEISPAERYVNYSEYALQADSARPNVTASISLSKIRLPEYGGEPTVTWSARQSAQAYSLSLDQGIEISEHFWARLGQLASKVLVESTEESRHGAGA